MTEQAEEKTESNLDLTDYSEFWMGKNPTPQERGEVIVKRLEKFIREGRSDQGGISFRRWQELAVHEVTNAIRDAEKHWRNDNRFVTRGLAVGAATIVTIGFWGTVMAAEVAPDRQSAALILIVAGGLLFAVLGVWGVRRLDRFYQSGRRRDHFRRVFNFDRQLAQLDVDLEKRLKELEETLDEMSKGSLGKL
ncbi:MAG: hypothetical protein HN884_06495 [Rhodospirillaceae bacterium]|jgi:hypothetical protein|nr:hypothetical protein [Rhodospirillaceae bacterium]MBT4590363.1 hypothetical protein [Rhodospirillaceae bacterium]MBT7266503.1 hypothetical protein [Rhodospirillaceae bacterium]